ncbi:MAG: hypothetical protein QOK07_2509, partial [Gemmatimonadaceae bacterium]|nr:hypothetical protein [Gemmatimonadaceae bacterium]
PCPPAREESAATAIATNSLRITGFSVGLGKCN